MHFIYQRKNQENEDISGNLLGLFQLHSAGGNFSKIVFRGVPPCGDD